jgi:hypothetical protein
VNTGSEKSGWVVRRVGDGDAESAADADASAVGDGVPSGSEVHVTSRISITAAGAHRDHCVVFRPLAELMGMTAVQLMVVLGDLSK